MKPLTSSRARTSILSPEFSYTRAIDTDISKRFARIRAAQREQREERGADTERVQNIFAARRKEGK